MTKNNRIDATNPLDLVYSPQDIVTIGSKYLDTRRHDKISGIPIGLTSLDEKFLPLLPGELMSIIARPGQGKTGFMMRWARVRAKWLQDNGMIDRVVVYATWEQSIEELYAFNVAADTLLSVTDMAMGKIDDGNWNSVGEYGAKRIMLPLWFIGHSIERRKKRPNLTVTNLAKALDNTERWDNGKIQIDMVFVDYLQRIKFENDVESKTIGVSDNLDRLKDGALRFGCPFVVGVQATRAVEERDMPIPQMEDGQWTSNIEQTSDKIFSLVRPRKYKQEGESFGKKSPVIVQGHSQMLVSCLKQKLGPDNWVKWVFFEPEYNRLDELEMRNVNLNGDSIDLVRYQDN